MKVFSQEDVERFDRDGFIVAEGLLSAAEVEEVLAIGRGDGQLQADTKANKNYEGEGRDTILAYRPHLADDVYSAWGRSRRIVGLGEQLLRGEIFHYYTLIMQKEPGTGGWQYHQDYGYHYDQFLFPDYISVMVALDPARRDNGCLKVYRGSNRLGRLQHQPSGSQRIADPERVGLAADYLEEVYCELEPGSVLYFHGNILHASEENLSQTPRWSLIYSYVAAANPVVTPEEPSCQYAFLQQLDDRQVAAAALRHRDRVNATATE